MFSFRNFIVACICFFLCLSGSVLAAGSMDSNKREALNYYLYMVTLVVMS